LALAAIAVAAIVVVKQSASTSPPLDPALIVVAKRGTLVISIVETGKVAPRERVEIKSRIAGQVAEVRVQEGEHVKKGQLLVVLDPIDYQREVAKADADVAQAMNGLAFAKLTLERKKAGVATSVTSQSDLDAAAADAVAKAVAVRSAEVALVTAQDQVRYTRIASPMDGTVIQRGIQPGETVVPGVQSTFDGKALLTVADLKVLVVKLELNQIDVAKTRIGQKAELTLDALPGKKYSATVTKITPASTHPLGKDVDVFPVEAELAEPDGRILPGMTADVSIRLDEKAGVLVLPIEAISKDHDKTYVQRVARDPKASSRTNRVEVTLGAQSDREAEVVSGLDEGDEVLLGSPSANVR
jgi:HlyD family secretion protein/macrolide-specific efflux system membrane fusion protein